MSDAHSTLGRRAADRTRRGTLGIGGLLALGLLLLASSPGSGEPTAGREPVPTRVPAASVTIEKGVRIKNGGTPGLYQFRKKLIRIYFNSSDVAGVATMKTRNGLKFRGLKSTGVQVLDAITADASVVKFEGKLRMYFKVAPLDDQDSHKVWRATATNRNGTKWEVDGLVYEHVEKPCFDWTSVPDAVVTGAGQVRLYFVCSKKTTQVASAISSDGVAFSFESVLIDNAVDPFVLRLDDGTYRIFYAARGGGPGGFQFNTIWTATSGDGLAWTDHELLLTAGDLDVDFSIDPAAYPLKKGKFRVYIATQKFDGGETVNNIYSIIYDPAAGRR